MDIASIKKSSEKIMKKRRAHLFRETGHIFYHGTRTATIALQLRKLIFPELETFDDILFAGALFHDVGKGIEPHAEHGSILVKHILKDYCSTKELEAISGIVQHHTHRSQPNTYPDSIRIVQDADILDHMGTTEIWMNFFYSCNEDKGMERSLEFYNGDMFKEYTSRMVTRLNYDISKKILDEKLQFVMHFVTRLEKEANGEIIWRTS